MRKTARISECGRYRYALERTWDESCWPLVFVMLNPSTADAEIDDPTIRRCMGYARREGFGGIHVANLFGLRATDPAELKSAREPFGGANNAALESLAERCAAHSLPIVCAWGAHGDLFGAASRALRILRGGYTDLRCLGKTKSGAPRHPLYVKADQPLAPFP